MAVVIEELFDKSVSYFVIIDLKAVGGKSFFASLILV